jgi:hypothetical protein
MHTKHGGWRSLVARLFRSDECLCWRIGGTLLRLSRR